MSSPLDMVLGNLENAKPYGRGYMAKCPAHEDRSASLSIAENEKGNAMVHCFAGCTARDVVGALGLRMGDLFSQPLSVPERKKRATKAMQRKAVEASYRVICAASPIAPPLNDDDMADLRTAVSRIKAALSLEGLQGAKEIRRIASYGDRILVGELLDEADRDMLTDCVEWISWLVEIQDSRRYLDRVEYADGGIGERQDGQGPARHGHGNKLAIWDTHPTG